MSHALRPELEPLLLHCCNAIGADPSGVHNAGVFLWQCLGTMDVVAADSLENTDNQGHRANTMNTSAALAVKSKEREHNTNTTSKEKNKNNGVHGAGARKNSTSAS